MKKILVLLLLLAAAKAQSQEPSKILIEAATFPGLVNEVKPGYGTTADNPIPSGAFMKITDRVSSENQMVKLKNSYRWPSGESLDFSRRFSTHGKTGIVDCYTLVRPESTDTVRLFVDPYHVSTQYFVPKGLIALTSEGLAKELVPYIKQAESLQAAPDASLLTEDYGKLLDYLAKTFGTGPFLDSEQIQVVATDEEADRDLRNYLIRCYVTGKFYAQAKNMADPQTYAFNQMKLSFQKYNTLHPEIKTGILKTTLK